MKNQAKQSSFNIVGGGGSNPSLVRACMESLPRPRGPIKGKGRSQPLNPLSELSQTVLNGRHSSVTMPKPVPLYRTSRKKTQKTSETPFHNESLEQAQPVIDRNDKRIGSPSDDSGPPDLGGFFIEVGLEQEHLCDQETTSPQGKGDQTSKDFIPPAEDQEHVARSAVAVSSYGKFGGTGPIPVHASRVKALAAPRPPIKKTHKNTINVHSTRR